MTGRWMLQWVAVVMALVTVTVAVRKIAIGIPGTSSRVVLDFAGAYTHATWRLAVFAAALAVAMAWSWRRCHAVATVHSHSGGEQE